MNLNSDEPNVVADSAQAPGSASVRVAMFHWCVPHYRIGVLNRVGDRPDIELTVFSPATYSDSSLNTGRAELRCSQVDIVSSRTRIPFSRSAITFQPRAVIEMLRGKYDVFIQPNDVLGVDVWVNALIARLRGRAVCLWGHGYSKKKRRAAQVLRRWLMRLTTASILYTPGVRDHWIAEGLSPDKLFVAYNALDTDEIGRAAASIGPSELAAFKASNGLDGKDVLVYSGRLIADKEPEIALEALRYILGIWPRAHMVFVGDGPMRSELMESARAHDLLSATTFAGAIYEEREIAKWFLSSTLAIMPLAAGLAIQHAFSYGVPVLLARSPETNGPEAELVIDGVNGFFCNPHEAKDFAQRALQILSSPTLHAQMRSECKRIIASSFNIDRMAAGITDAARWTFRQIGRADKGGFASAR